MKTIRTCALLAACALATGATASAQTKLEKAVISNGGGIAVNGAMRAEATIAQPAIGVASNGQTVGQFGFWTADAGVVLGVTERGAGAITRVALAPNPA